jgi:hypothetical protein
MLILSFYRIIIDIFIIHILTVFGPGMIYVSTAQGIPPLLCWFLYYSPPPPTDRGGVYRLDSRQAPPHSPYLTSIAGQKIVKALKR